MLNNCLHASRKFLRYVFTKSRLLIWLRWQTLQRGLIHKTVRYITGCLRLCHTAVTGHVTRYVCDWSLSGRNRPCGLQLRWQIWCCGRTCYLWSLRNQPQQRHSCYWIPLQVVFWFSCSLPFSCSYRIIFISVKLLWNICIVVYSKIDGV